MPFDIAKARAAKKSDTQIADYLGKTYGFDVAKARASGKTDTQIAEYLSKNDKPGTKPVAPVEPQESPEAKAQATADTNSAMLGLTDRLSGVEKPAESLDVAGLQDPFARVTNPNLPDPNAVDAQNKQVLKTKGFSAASADARKAMPERKETLAKQFDAEWNKQMSSAKNGEGIKERTKSDVWTDAAKQFTGGLVSTAAGISWLADKVPGIDSEDLTAHLSGFSDYLGEIQSDQARAEAKSLENAKTAGETFETLISNPLLISKVVLESMPIVIPGMGLAAVSAKAAFSLGVKKALAKGATKEAAILAGRAAAVAAASVAGKGSEAMLSGGMSGNDTQRAVMKMPEWKLEAVSERYRELTLTMTPLEARKQLAGEVSVATAIASGTATAVGGAFAAKLNKMAGLGDTYAAQLIRNAQASKVVKEFGGETTEEVSQSFLEQIAGNVTNVDDTTGTFDEVGKSVVMGATGAIGQTAATQSLGAASRGLIPPAPTGGPTPPAGGPTPAPAAGQPPIVPPAPAPTGGPVPAPTGAGAPAPVPAATGGVPSAVELQAIADAETANSRQSAGLADEERAAGNTELADRYEQESGAAAARAKAALDTIQTEHTGLQGIVNRNPDISAAAEGIDAAAAAANAASIEQEAIALNAQQAAEEQKNKRIPLSNAEVQAGQLDAGNRAALGLDQLRDDEELQPVVPATATPATPAAEDAPATPATEATVDENLPAAEVKPSSAGVSYPNRKLSMDIAKSDENEPNNTVALANVALANMQPGDKVPVGGGLVVKSVGNKAITFTKPDGKTVRFDIDSPRFEQLIRDVDGAISAHSVTQGRQSAEGIWEALKRDPAFSQDEQGIPQLIDKKPQAATAKPKDKAPAPQVSGAPTDVVLQNRDRSTPALVTQMNKIAANPSPIKAGFSRDFANGAPVITQDTAVIPENQMGNKSVVVTAGDRKIEIQYAVIEAADLLTSHAVDGTANEGYQTGLPGKARTIAGNGRGAGIKAGFKRGSTDAYVEGTANDESLHGVSAEVIRGMKEPILVRIMQPKDITANIGDESNQGGIADKDPLTHAKDDSRRINVADIEFGEDGHLTRSAIMQFVLGMPASESAGLIGRDGEPITTAKTRLMNAVFWSAYGSEALTELYAQATDPEARVIMNALAIAGTEMVQLGNLGEDHPLDIRRLVAEAAEAVINAKRQGITLANYIEQGDLALDANVLPILRMFNENSRSAKKIAEKLKEAATFVLVSVANSNDGGFFDAPPLPNLDDALGKIHETGRKTSVVEQKGPTPNGVNAEQATTNTRGQRNNEQAAEDGQAPITRPEAMQVVRFTPSKENDLGSEITGTVRTVDRTASGFRVRILPVGYELSENKELMVSIPSGGTLAVIGKNNENNIIEWSDGNAPDDDSANAKFDRWIQQAADSLAELRAIDIDRVLSNAQSPDSLRSVGRYISNGRPDLAERVKSDTADIMDDNGWTATQEQADAFSLDAQTEGDIAAKEAREQQDTAKADEKKRIDATADAFSLSTGTVSTSDQMKPAVSGGGAGLFDQTRGDAKKDAKAANLIAIDAELGDALDDLADLMNQAGRPGQLNSGIDPVLMGKILGAGLKVSGILLKKGAVKFSIWAENMIAALKSKGVDESLTKQILKKVYLASKADADRDIRSQMDSEDYVLDYDVEIIGADEASNDKRTANSAESDSANGPDANTVTDGNLRNEERGQVGRGANQPGQGNNGQQQPTGTASVSAGNIPATRERSNQQMGEQGPSRDAQSPARSADGAGSGVDSTGGLYAQRAQLPVANQTIAAANAVALPEVSASEASNISVADREEVKKTMPFLTEGQVDDVVFAEKRLEKPDGFGVLFTNGTGTGKTFSGLGIIARMVANGRDNILIVAPKQPVVDSWAKAASQFFGLKTKQLSGKKDNGGSGIVITTFANMGDNDSLINREWDAIVLDEAHYLSQNADGKATSPLNVLRALTKKEGSNFDAVKMRNPEMYARLEKLGEDLKTFEVRAAGDDRMNTDEGDKINAEMDSITEKLSRLYKEEAESIAATPDNKKPRSIFLSATPFAYDKSIMWANGYLFDWGSKADSTKYNSGSNQDRFMMQHLGWRMRYNKLTAPDAKVDSALMQRTFNTYLKKQGVLSGRSLTSDFDYDRKFVIVNDAIGKRVDDAIAWLQEKSGGKNGIKGMDEVNATITESNFNYHARMYFLEAIKSRASFDHIKQHLALGRKVVVMHDFKQGGAKNPFIAKFGDPEAEAAYQLFVDEFGDLIRLFDYLESPVEQMAKEFPGALIYNGNVSGANRVKMQDAFNSDEPGSPTLIIAQGDAMREGVSIHDTTGKHQRVLVHLGLPVTPAASIQQEGRIFRTGQATNALFRYITIGSGWERNAFATTIARRAGTVENLAMGELARGLKQSFIEAYEGAGDFPPGFDGEGTGGKSYDASLSGGLSQWDMAKSYYFGTKKQGKGRGAEGREGVDYFATPEPVGLKMVEWADIRGGEKVLEPSAGHGAIARWFPENADVRAIESSAELASRVALRVVGDVVNGQFENHNIVNKYDAIVMNPPFGVGGKTAVEHLAKAAVHLSEGGRVVALIPTGPAADKQFDKWFYATDDKGKSLHADLHLVRTITLPSSTFERAGTSVSTRIVVIEKAGKELAQKVANISRIDLSDASSVEELFERIEKIEMPPRAKEEAPDAETPLDGREAFALGFERVAPEHLSNAQKRTWEKAFDKAKRNGDAGTKEVSENEGPLPTQIGGEEIIEHTTQAGKVIRGTVRMGITHAEAKAIDKFTFRKDGGYFIREKHLTGNTQPPAEPLYSRQGGSWYYSPLTKEVKGIKQESALASQWRAMLSKASSGVRAEADATGLIDYLEVVGGKVSKDQIIDFLSGNAIRIEEHIKSDSFKDEPGYEERVSYLRNLSPKELTEEYEDVTGDDSGLVNDIEGMVNEILSAESESGNPINKTKYSKYVVPGGSNYKELLITLPDHDNSRFSELDAKYKNGTLSPAEESEYSRLERTPDRSYKSGHWNEANILVHVRFDERTDADGKKVLFINEIQSDWGQEGKKKGFRGEFPNNVLKAAINGGMTEQQARADIQHLLDAPIGTDERPTGDQWRRLGAATEGASLDLNEIFHDMRIGAPPSAPFVTKTDAWVSLAIKRMIRHAAENGFDRVAFINGQQSADLYDLSKQVDSLTLKDKMATMGEPGLFVIAQKDGRNVIERTVSDENELSDLVGKEVAARLMEAPLRGGERNLSGLDLKVGGEGMRTFYDKIVPKVVGDVIKKLGGGKLIPVRLSQSKPVRKYSGPSLSADAVIGVARDDNLRAAVQSQLREVVAKMRTGSSLAEAMEFHGSDASAKAIGGVMTDTEELVVLEQTGFDITPEMKESVSAGLPLFKKESTAAKGKNTKAAVQAIVSPITAKWKSGITAIVVQSVSDLPIGSVPGDVEGLYLGDGVAYLIADNLPNENRVLEVLAHEAIGHAAMEEMLGNDLMEELTKEIGAWIKNKSGVFVALSNEVNKRQPGLSPRVHAKEIIALMAERGMHKKGNIWNRVVGAVRAWIRSIGMPVKWLSKLSGPDLFKMLADAEKYVKNGDGPNPGARSSTNEAYASKDALFSVFGFDAEYSPEEISFMQDLGLLTQEEAETMQVVSLNKEASNESNDVLRGNPEGAGRRGNQAGIVSGGAKARQRQTRIENSPLLGRMRKISDRAATELRGEAETERTVDSPLGFFSGYVVRSEQIEPDSMYPDGHLQISVFGKEQIEAGLNDEPALLIVVAKNGELIINGPSSDGDTFKEFQRRGWADFAKDADGNKLGAWTALSNPGGKKLPPRQVIGLLADTHARLRTWKQTEKARLHWVRSTGATGGMFDSFDDGRQYDGGRGGNVYFSRPAYDGVGDTYKLPPARNLVIKLFNKFDQIKRVTDAVKEQGGSVDVLSDVFGQEEAFHSRAASYIDRFRRHRLGSIIKRISKAGVKLEDVGIYLYAQHAEERNRQIATFNPGMPDGGSGMPTAEANQILADFQARPDIAKLDTFAKEFRDIIADTRNRLRTSGLESNDSVDAWEAMYSFYIPLAGKNEADNPTMAATGRGYDIRGGQKRALGRKDRARHVIEQIIIQHEAAVIRSEKNVVGKRLLKFVTDNPDNKLWAVNPTEQRRYVNADGEVDFRNAPLRTDKNVVSVRIDGKDTFIFLEDESMARAMKNMGSEDIGVVLRVLGVFSRFTSKMFTAFSPAFVLMNAVRDFMTAMIHGYQVGGVGYSAKIAKNMAWAFSQMVQDAWSGDNAAVKLYEQSGGRTGMVHMIKDLQEKHEEVASQMAALNGVSISEIMDAFSVGFKEGRAALARKARYNIFTKPFDALFSLIESVNGVVENTTRLAAFQAAIETGKTVREAGSIAKNLTVNFNRKGEYAAGLGAAYIFFNASVQGSARMYEALKDRRLQAVAGGMALLSFAIAALQMDDDDDEDKDGRPDLEQVPAWQRSRNIIIMQKGGGYIKIPLPLGWNAFHMIGTELAVMTRSKNKESYAEGLGNIVMQAMGVFNPVGDFVPSVAAPFVEIMRNKSHFGSKIYPDYKDKLPNSQQFYDGTEGNVYERATSAANKTTGGNEFRGGWLDINPEKLQHIVEFFGGGALKFITDTADTVTAMSDGGPKKEADKIPIAKAFYGKIRPEYQTTRYYDNKDKVLAVKREIDGLKDAQQPEEAAKVLAKNPWVDGLSDMMKPIDKDMKKLKADERAIRADDKLSAGERRKELEAVRVRRGNLVKDFNSQYEFELRKK